MKEVVHMEHILTYTRMVFVGNTTFMAGFGPANSILTSHVPTMLSTMMTRIFLPYQNGTYPLHDSKGYHIRHSRPMCRCWFERWSVEGGLQRCNSRPRSIEFRSTHCTAKSPVQPAASSRDEPYLEQIKEQMRTMM